MKFSDAKESLLDFWREFRMVKSGLFGLVLFLLFLAIVIFEPFILPFPDVNKTWRDITYWEENPKGAPPVWINWFSAKKRPLTQVFEDPKNTEAEMGNMKMVSTVFEYELQADYSPQDLIFKARASGEPMFIVTLKRPDGEEVTVFQNSINLGNKVTDVRITLNGNGRENAIYFARPYESDENYAVITPKLVKAADVVFSQAKEGIFRNPETLKGTYEIVVQTILRSANDQYMEPRLVVPGKAFGVLGTDALKRDIWSGVLAGVKWALLIGILTAVVSVSIGVIYGVISAYLGGWKDGLMQRIFEIFVSVPLLPVLIVMSAVFKPSIWTLIIMMSCFFWTGSVKTVRSIALQIKEETYIEASKALGANNFRIIFKHMVPLLIPYSFASMALYIPGAIVYEATISLLGLGDATIVTWGQILSDALSSGAVLSGLWWWVVPPGLSIAFMGMAFAFIGFAMDKILHPKLRTR
ncbi:MAG TPA: ABC transporter permease [Thermotogota bacterium]|nr:ABC transporter permease [Thermotogota bacterium]